MDECLAGTVVEIADEAATLGAVLEPLDDLVPSICEHDCICFIGYNFVIYSVLVGVEALSCGEIGFASSLVLAGEVEEVLEGALSCIGFLPKICGVCQFFCRCS